MAKTSAVWGIDIGNTSLKALRCRQAVDNPGRIEALAYDFVEHSKILSQPGAEPQEILAETLKTFLERNSTKGDQVAISVSGQNTISRFLKLPPVDPKKIPDIIRYEAKQWLPFDLDDVIWDFQPIGGAAQSDTAVPLDAEIGMFAMKRDIAMKTLAPYLGSGIDIDCIQSAPLSIYNFAAYDQLTRINIEDYDPDDPPESLVVLCVGTDATDVVITNGFSIWIRSIPIGGNVFTKALTKGLKLTFSKAEYLKRNAKNAQDAKAVFQAMSPVFNDMLSEVHRSIEYYQSLNRKAKFSRILAMGNAMKLTGLRKFLTQNLGYEVTLLSQFNRLIGAKVIDQPTFKENIYSFGVAYGLALQQLNESALSTNLIPREIVVDRIVREKKPWVLTGAATLMLGLVIQFAGASRALETISTGDYERSENQAKTVSAYSAKMKSDTSTVVSTFQEIDNIGKNLTSNVEGRITWLELLRALNAALPVETEKLDGKAADAVAQQNRVFISNVEAVTVDDLAAWFEPLKEFERYYPDDNELREIIASGTAPASSEEGSEESEDASAQDGPKTLPRSLKDRLELVPGPAEGEGRVVQIVGFHYHNAADVETSGGETVMGSAYVRDTLIHNLKYGEVFLPSTLEKQVKENAQAARDLVSMRELGISYPTLLDIPKIIQTQILNPRVLLELYLEERREMLDQNRSGGNFGGGGGFSPGRRGAGQSGIQNIASSMATSFSSSGPGRRGMDGGGGGAGTKGKSTADYIKEISQKIDAKDKILLRRFDFVVQFAWVETPPSAREQKREEERLAAMERREQAGSSSSVLDSNEDDYDQDENEQVNEPMNQEPETQEPEVETEETETETETEEPATDENEETEE